jgi:trigger factor
MCRLKNHSLADALLENEDEKRKMSEQVLEGKVIKHVKTVVKLEEKEISVEDFYKLFDEN